MGFSKVLIGSERILDQQPTKDGHYVITNQSRLTLDLQGDHEAVMEVRKAVRELIAARVPEYDP